GGRPTAFRADRLERRDRCALAEVVRGQQVGNRSRPEPYPSRYDPSCPNVGGNMTTLTRPTAPPRRGPRSDPRHPRRHAGALRPEQLPRPIPRSQWDPLTDDVEAKEKVDYELPPTLGPPGLPFNDLSRVPGFLTKPVWGQLLGAISSNNFQRGSSTTSGTSSAAAHT